jgi:protein-tyrosine phosphatase
MSAIEPFVDIHCHLLPGIDDGAEDVQEALGMARMAVTDGIGTVVVTPHQLGNYRHNGGALVRARTAELQRLLVEHQIPLRVLPGADVRIEVDMLALVRRGDVLTLADRRRHVLLELPHELYMPLEPLLAELRSARLVGILSHPERNLGLLEDPRPVRRLVDAGCLMQVTAGSLLGTFGEPIKKLAESLVAQGLVHFVSTDAHGLKSRRPVMHKAFECVAKLTDWERAIDLCCRFPALVAEGGTVPQGRMKSHRRPRRAWWPWSRVA